MGKNMRKRVIISAPLAVLAALTLAGCNSNQSASTVTTAPGAAATYSRAVGPTRAPGGPNMAAEDICVKAVQQQTNADGVAVINSEFSQAATLVMIGFPAAQAPWRCLVAQDGSVTEVVYTGSEGRL